MDDLPVLPYAGTSGHGGNGPSKDRAAREDSTGVTKGRQRVAMNYLRQEQGSGATWKELGDFFGYHAGQSSGCLSVLHKEGFIVRLKQRRDGCSVYVLPKYVYGRETSTRGSHAQKLCERCLCEIEDTA